VQLATVVCDMESERVLSPASFQMFYLNLKLCVEHGAAQRYSLHVEASEAVNDVCSECQDI